MTKDPKTFSFDPKVYRMSAIKKAAYRFSARFSIEIHQADGGPVYVSLIPLDAPRGPLLHAEEFPGEVLDQELREAVAEETKSVRDLILAQAFSGLALTDPVGENADFRDDPMGIGDMGKRA